MLHCARRRPVDAITPCCRPTPAGPWRISFPCHTTDALRLTDAAIGLPGAASAPSPAHLLAAQEDRGEGKAATAGGPQNGAAVVGSFASLVPCRPLNSNSQEECGWNASHDVDSLQREQQREQRLQLDENWVLRMSATVARRGSASFIRLPAPLRLSLCSHARSCDRGCARTGDLAPKMAENRNPSMNSLCNHQARLLSVQRREELRQRLHLDKCQAPEMNTGLEALASVAEPL